MAGHTRLIDNATTFPDFKTFADTVPDNPNTVLGEARITDIEWMSHLSRTKAVQTKVDELKEVTLKLNKSGTPARFR